MIKDGDKVFLDKRGCFGNNYDRTLGQTNILDRLEKNVIYTVHCATNNNVMLKHNYSVYNIKHFKKYV